MKRILFFLLLISSIASAQKTSDLPLYNGGGIDSALFNGFINNTNRKIYGKDIANINKTRLDSIVGALGSGQATTDASALTSGTLSDSRLSTAARARESDYIIEKIGSTFYAHPRGSLTAYSGTDAYTVIQAAINALTPAGARGSGGGKIHIAKGTYTLTNELQIIGWEGVAASSWDPYSQLVIEGEGSATVLYCNTAGKNTLLVKNDASIALFDIKLEAGSAARSALRLDAGGAQGEISVFGGAFDNLYLKGSSSTYPAFYAANFFDLNVGYLHVVNTSGDGIIFDNVSTTTLYGNSNFSFIRVQASTSSPYSGMKFTSSDGANWRCINLMNFSSYQCVSGYYGVNIVDASNITFDAIDIEYGVYGFYSNGGTLARNNKVLSGLISASNTCIYNGATSGANYFACELGGSGTTIPIADAQSFMPPNEYDVTLTGTLDPALISLTGTAPSRTKLTYRDSELARTYTTLPENTTVDDLTMTGVPVAPTPTVNTNTTQVATTAFVIAQRTGTFSMTNKTMSGASNTFSNIPQSAITGLEMAVQNSMRQVLVSNVALSHTGNTTETTIYTGTIPANSIGVNGSFIASFISSTSNSAGTKTFRLKFNGTTVYSYTPTTSLAQRSQAQISNRNSLTSQIAGPIAVTGFGVAASNAVQTFTVDTGVDIIVTVTVQLSSGTDTATLEALQIMGIG